MGVNDVIACYEDCIKVGNEKYSFDPIQILLFDRWLLEGTPLNWVISTVTKIKDEKSKNYGKLVKNNRFYFSSFPQALQFLQNHMLIGKPKIIENGVRKKRKDFSIVPKQSFDEAMNVLKNLENRINETHKEILNTAKTIIENEAALSAALEVTSVKSSKEYKALIQKFLRTKEKTGEAKVFVKKRKRKRNGKSENGVKKRSVGTAVLKHKKHRRGLA